MKRSVKLWLEALRSGKYEQGKDQLVEGQPGEERYCCLGVACAVYNKHHKKKVDLYSGEQFALRMDKKVVKQWLGLRTTLGHCNAGYTLTRLNDRGTSFSKIADIIESEPEGLFK